jgi:hypothetical protein
MSMGPPIKCPPGVREFRSVHKIPVALGNISTMNSSDPYPRGYQYRTFVSLKSGEIVAPVLRLKNPRMNRCDFFPRVHLENYLGTGMSAVGENFEYLELPKDDEIDTFLILLRRIGEDPWRVWELNSDTVFAEEGAVLALPPLEPLPLLETRSDAKELLSKGEAAQACVEEYAWK